MSYSPSDKVLGEADTTAEEEPVILFTFSSKLSFLVEGDMMRIVVLVPLVNFIFFAPAVKVGTSGKESFSTNFAPTKEFSIGVTINPGRVILSVVSTTEAEKKIFPTEALLYDMDTV